VIVVVADASPLIAPERIGRLELLKALFELGWDWWLRRGPHGHWLAG